MFESLPSHNSEAFSNYDEESENEVNVHAQQATPAPLVDNHSRTFLSTPNSSRYSMRIRALGDDGRVHNRSFSPRRRTVIPEEHQRIPRSSRRLQAALSFSPSTLSPTMTYRAQPYNSPLMQNPNDSELGSASQKRKRLVEYSEEEEEEDTTCSLLEREDSCEWFDDSE